MHGAWYGRFSPCALGRCRYVIYPPETKNTPDAPIQARQELAKLGPMSLDEKITAGALGLTVSLWIFGGALGISAVAAALLGLSILLITNVTTWKNCLSDNQVHPIATSPARPPCHTSQE